MAQITDLPSELILLICKNIDSISDLASFSTTYRRVYACANPRMYILDAQQTRSSGPNALLWGVYKDNYDVAEKAISAGADPNTVWISAYPRAEVDHMMDRGTPRRELDTPVVAGKVFSWAAMHLAIIRGNEEMVRLLLDHNSRVNVSSTGFCSCETPRNADMMALTPVPSQHPWSLLHTAFCFGQDAIAKLLVIRGASATLEGIYSPETLSFDGVSHEPYSPEAYKLVMNTAAWFGCPETLEYVIPKAEGLDEPDYFGRTPLLYAVFGEAPEKVVPVLLEAGRNLGSKTMTDKRVFFGACRRAHYHAALILTRGGVLDNRSDKLHIALRVARSRDGPFPRADVRFRLKTLGRRIEPLERAMLVPYHVANPEHDEFDPRPEWCARSRYYDPLRPENSLASVQAARNKAVKEDLILLIIEKDETDPVLNLGMGQALLATAAKRHLSKVVKTLIKKGFDVSHKDDRGNTVLMSAISSYEDEGDPIETIESLISVPGTDLNTQNKDGDTALHLLCHGSFIRRYSFDAASRVARALVSAKADPAVRNSRGEIPSELGQLLNPNGNQ